MSCVGGGSADWVVVSRRLRSGHPIYVFGSNLNGVHGAGTALTAKLEYGAVTGVSEGPTGQAYAIPTRERLVGGHFRTLSLVYIKRRVDDFVELSHAHASTTFLLTRVGCGLAGYTDEQMAPLFAGCGSNVLFPARWIEILEGRS